MHNLGDSFDSGGDVFQPTHATTVPDNGLDALEARASHQ